MKLLKGWLCIALAAALTLQVFAVSDMPGDWAKAAVEKAVGAKIINISADKVRAGENLKRWELGFILSAAFGAAKTADLSKFTDVKAVSEAYAPMAKAVKMGLFTGEGTLLRPNDAITRQEAFAVLARALGLKASTNSALDQFTDKNQIADWAKPELSALTSSKVISGSGGKLNPTASITRKEFCQVLYNLFRDYHSTGVLTAAAGGVVVRAGGTTIKNVTINGDLIIGDGVADGTVTLDNVTVTGRVVVRSGDVTVSGAATKIGAVTIMNSYGKTNFTVSPELMLGALDVRSPAVISGAFTALTLSANQAEISGFVKDVRVLAKTTLSLKEGAMTDIVFEQNTANSTFTVGQGVTVLSLTANAGIIVQGLGSISTVYANASGVSVQIPNSKVTARSDVLSVMAFRTTIAPGFTVATLPNGGTKPYVDLGNSDASLAILKVGGKSLPNFDPKVFYYAFPIGVYDSYSLEAVAGSSRATITAVQATSLGKKATVTVTAPDGISKMTYTVYMYKK